MRPWFLLLLAGLAEVGALLPITLVVGHLMPIQSFTPFVLLLVWFGGWVIAARMPGRKAVLSPPLLLVGAVLAWPGGLTGIRQEPLGLILILVPLVAAWWGGSQIGSQWLTWHSAYEGLRQGIWVCLGGLALLAFAGSVGLTAFLGPLVLFATGLPLLYLLRIGVSGHSAATTFFALAPMVILGLLALGTSPAMVGSALHVVGRVLSSVATLVITPLAYLLSLVFPGLIALLQRGFGTVRLQPVQQCPNPNQQATESCPPPDQLKAPPDVAGPDLRLYVIVVLLILLVWVLFALTKKLRVRQRRNERETDVDEIITGPGFLKGLVRDLRSLFQARVVEPVLMSLPTGDPRWLLRRLQAWGARKGCARRAGETPLQYAQALRPELPQGADPMGLDSLSTAYGQARYGSGTPNPQLVADAEALLARLESPSK